MLYRITTTYADNTTNSTTVAVELIEQTGIISKITGKVQFSIPGVYDYASDILYREVGLVLVQEGYNVIVPELTPTTPPTTPPTS